jgi:hypothetical protein
MTIPQPDATKSSAGQTQSRPSIDAVQRDIALANQYRLELIKYLLAIAAALFAFTIAFRPSLTQVDVPWAMWIGWFGLGVSMFGGIFHMQAWDHYYKSYRDHDHGNKDPKEGKRLGKAARTKINKRRKSAMFFQFVGFIVGVIGIALFAGVNIDNVRKSEEKQRGSNKPPGIDYGHRPFMRTPPGLASPGLTSTLPARAA